MRIDHALHFLAGWILVDFMAPFMGLHAAILAAVAIGLGKEIIWDMAMDRGEGDPVDFVAGALGALFASLWWSDWLLVALWVFWNLFIYMMGVYRAFLSGRLKGLSLAMAAPVLAVAFVVDFLMQMTVFNVIFWEVPRELLVTNRLRRMMSGPNGWRRRLAEYLCMHLLDPFDPTGAHCDSEKPTLEGAP